MIGLREPCVCFGTAGTEGRGRGKRRWRGERRGRGERGTETTECKIERFLVNNFGLRKRLPSLSCDFM